MQLTKQQGEHHFYSLVVLSLALAAFVYGVDTMICIGFKRCTKCGEIKGLKEFDECKCNKDGLGYWCKDCVSRYYQQNKTIEQKYKFIKKIIVIILFEDFRLKLCAKCGEIKELSEFGKGNDRFGLRYWCRGCVKQDHQNHKEETEQWRQKNKERNLKEGISITEKRCSKCGKTKSVDEFDKDSGSKDGLGCWCKDCVAQDYQNHKEEKKEYRQSRRKETREWQRNRRRTNPLVKINTATGNAIRQSLKRGGGSKNGYHWETFFDYTCQDLITHLESKFKDGMTWDNYGKGPGKWVIDHIRPISSFNFTSTDDEEFKQCWALENLQPLWWEENMAKGAKWLTTE